MKVKEACLISIVNQLIESDLLERQKQAKSHKQLFQMAKILDINTGRIQIESFNDVVRHFTIPLIWTVHESLIRSRASG